MRCKGTVNLFEANSSKMRAFKMKTARQTEHVQGLNQTGSFF